MNAKCCPKSNSKEIPLKFFLTAFENEAHYHHHWSHGQRWRYKLEFHMMIFCYVKLKVPYGEKWHLCCCFLNKTLQCNIPLYWAFLRGLLPSLTATPTNYTEACLTADIGFGDCFLLLLYYLT